MLAKCCNCMDWSRPWSLAGRSGFTAGYRDYIIDLCIARTPRRFPFLPFHHEG